MVLFKKNWLRETVKKIMLMIRIKKPFDVRADQINWGKCKKTIKTLTVFVPFDFSTGNFGGGLRVLNEYKALSKHFRIFAIAVPGIRKSPFKINDNFTVIPIPTNRNFWELLKEEEKKAGGHLNDVLFTDHYDLVPGLKDIFLKLFNITDIFISSHPYFFKMFKNYGGDKSLMYEAHNVDAELKKTYLNSNNIYAKKYLDTVEEVESIACNESAIVSAVSEQDKNGLSKRYGIEPDKVVVVPNGVDCSSCEFIPYSERLRRSKERSIVFVSSAHGPNIEAVDFIINFLAPADKKNNYLIIGNVDIEYVGKNIPDNVKFLGILNNSEKNKVLADASVAINPMFSGGGTNLKVLEYLACGLPLISTKYGMRGFEQLMNYAFIADDDNFLNVITEVMSMRVDKLDENSLKARGIVKNNFDWTVVTRELINRLIV